MKVKKARDSIEGMLFFLIFQTIGIKPVTILAQESIWKDWLRIPYEVEVNCLQMWYLSKSLKGYRKTQLIRVYSGRELSMQPGLQMGHYFDLCVDVVLILNTV